MDYAATAKGILEQVGSESNVISATHCMTRLRLVLKDESSVDDEKVKAIPGVVGVMRKSGQYQIIIGNNVAKCYAELLKLGSFSETPAGDADKKGKTGKKRVNIFSAILDAISGSIAPIIPAIIGAGMIRVLYIILNFWIPAENSTMTILNAIADAAFYFLPVLIAFAAGKKFGANPFLTAAVVGVLIHPNIISHVSNAAEHWATFLGIPVLNTSYSSSVLPAIIVAYAMSWIEKGVDKITPAVTKNFLKPMLIILISAPLELLILGPIGSYIGLGLAWVITNLNVYVPWLVAIVMAVAMPYLVMTGMHWAFISVTLAALETPEGEMLMLPAMLAANLAIGGACFAIAVREKNKGQRQEAAASGISALLAGVTEPGLYGTLLPRKKPLATVAVACFAAGLISGIARVAASAFASPSWLSITIFVHGDGFSNLVWAIVVGAVATVLSFVLTLFLPEFTKMWNRTFGRRRAARAAADGADNDAADGLGEDTAALSPAENALPAADAAVENMAASAADFAANHSRNGSDGFANAADGAENADTGSENAATGSAKKSAEREIASPLAGKLIPLSEVPDETFLAGVLGKGAAVVPAEGKVYAPFAGAVETAMGHALGLISRGGVELLIHVGLETVNLQGKHFICRVAEGQTFEKGDLLLEFDQEAIEAEGYNTVTPVIVTNADDFAEVEAVSPREVKAGETILKIS